MVIWRLCIEPRLRSVCRGGVLFVVVKISGGMMPFSCLAELFRTVPLCGYIYPQAFLELQWTDLNKGKPESLPSLNIANLNHP
jgi:hypothetical protein